jgi:hypothetical protein
MVSLQSPKVEPLMRLRYRKVVILGLSKQHLAQPALLLSFRMLYKPRDVLNVCFPLSFSGKGEGVDGSALLCCMSISLTMLCTGNATVHKRPDCISAVFWYSLCKE